MMRMSRMERILEQLEEAARRGKAEITLELYKSEVERLRREGLSVEITGESSMKDQLITKTAWYGAFGFHDVPEGLFAYICGYSNEMPKPRRFAEKLYMLTCRAKK